MEWLNKTIILHCTSSTNMCNIQKCIYRNIHVVNILKACQFPLHVGIIILYARSSMVSFTIFISFFLLLFYFHASCLLRLSMNPLHGMLIPKWAPQITRTISLGVVTFMYGLSVCLSVCPCHLITTHSVCSKSNYFVCTQVFSGFGFFCIYPFVYSAVN